MDLGGDSDVWAKVWVVCELLLVTAFIGGITWLIWG